MDLLYFFIGITSCIIGGYIWWNQESTSELINKWIVLSIILIVIGSLNILRGVNEMLSHFSKDKQTYTNKPSLYTKLFIILLIFLGSLAYTTAAYYHLKIKNWTFAKALLIAIPFILIEYQFSIRGNYHAHNILKLNALQITLLTMTFYFINAWLLNYFVLKNKVVWWRELLAFMCICGAFILSTTTNKL